MNDPLDRMLRADAQVALVDEGFSARVMGALPRPAKVPHRRLQPALVLGSAITGCILAALFAPADAGVAQGFLDIAHLKIFTPAAVAGLAMAAALFISAVVLAAE